MCPPTKLPVKQIRGKKKHSNPACPYCACTVVWKLATHTRTGTHTKEVKNPPDAKIVQRCVCKNPSCGKSFSVLPPGILPYCRFAFDDFLSIFRRFQAGESAYSIWKSWSCETISLKVIKRLCTHGKRILAFISSWFRETGNAVTGILDNICHPLLKMTSWFSFTTRWYHSLYPRRIWPNPNPHNLAP